ncbi:MAG: 30S ribosomal protein S17 [Candidatus Omnitrophica bacterium]|nr:30S ribosomal protein S17 [Candidatus Omnitrophota bacterium]MDE2008514.1 30S ribosomal protein S17 [Candidatus Omnitrophota bacterium]MDE2213980.1 30S ribosomal protein S17 [Candidatus Omnitrophota bacterium]MDE2231365.1 30S ribosomal protein S17 [Candidatus Omnitrophota bacterium]
METRANRRKFLTAVVVSDKMDKTRVVQVRNVQKHGKYQKQVRSFIRYKAHDEKNAAKTGDVVRIMETRPLSKDKRWIISEIVPESGDRSAAKA